MFDEHETAYIKFGELGFYKHSISRFVPPSAEIREIVIRQRGQEADVFEKLLKAKAQFLMLLQ